MHLDKYEYLSEEDKEKIKWAFDLVKQKRVVPSMRSMQFGGKAVFAHNARIYNCGVRHIDSLRAFAEVFYSLLCGTGMTLGVSEKVISLLPDLVSKKDKSGSVVTYVIEDTIEGWADAVECLLMCYHKNTPFTGRKIVFDYSKIRTKGTPLKTGGGKAPGHEGLKQTLEKIKQLLDYTIEELHLSRLRSIDIYDILMHCADAVLSGGIRRAATAVIFDPTDELMMNAKTNFTVSSHKRFEQLPSGYWEGTVIVNKKKYEVTISDWEYQNDLKKNNSIGWWYIEPQRARSNNSVLLLRHETTLEQFKDIVEKTKQWGEPGFVFADDPYTLYNPCVTGDTIVETNLGKLSVEEICKKIENKENIFALTMNEETKELEYKQILHGEKTKLDETIIQLETSEGDKIKLTPDHLVFIEGKGYIKAKDLVEDDEIISFE
jgi:ribonucleoside-diphosphate reductase alpha chain